MNERYREPAALQGDLCPVLNQPPPFAGHDAFSQDPWLVAAVRRAGIEGLDGVYSEMGRFVASAEAHHHAVLANRYTPELHTHDRYGHRIDAVEYHPSWHVLMKRAFGAGLHSMAWKRSEAPFSSRAALFYLWNQLEQGTSCPTTMTFASIPMFEHAPDLAGLWKPKILADAYDPRPERIEAKTGATIGMAMTEKQGGSDLREVQTAATKHGSAWRLNGHKWFCSAPMSDAFFTLARGPEGVTCFFVPRTLPDGKRNAFRIQRLKEKVGNRSNASSEIEYHDTGAWLVGEPGRGIATLINMAHHTRFDIVVAVAGMMRAALNEALHHARHRSAFGKHLADHGLMRNVLADLALEAEGAMLLAFRLAQAFDRAGADPREREIQRVLTPIAKYWLCKRMTPVATEAMECLGGNGYVEESPLARLWREAPLNGIWEGSANVICLDALRALGRSPEAFKALADEAALAADERIDGAVAEAARILADPDRAQTQARAIVESLALAMQASLMKRYSDAAAAEAFCAARLASGRNGRTLGTLELDSTRLGELVERARVA
jgi:putative acyl-CoA dehydrogenase